MTNPAKPLPLRVLNPRAIHQAPHLSELLRQAGTQPIELPTLCIEGMPPAWLNKLPPLNAIAQAIFVSPNAVDFFFKHVNPSLWPSHIINLSLGMGTAKKLMHHGITVHMMPNDADSEHFIHLETLQNINKRCLSPHEKICLSFHKLNKLVSLANIVSALKILSPDRPPALTISPQARTASAFANNTCNIDFLWKTTRGCWKI